MTKLLHRIYLSSMVITVVAVTIFISYTGYSYYILPIEERFFHHKYDWFKPSGAFGHGLGIIGTLMVLFGVGIYILRKRYGFLQRYIRLKYLLEFHIFLCTLGPILILFHTSFKFGGIVSISFWSMVAVVLSGVIGRFIYIQIPRTIEGRALNVHEIHSQRESYINQISEIKLDNETKSRILEYTGDSTVANIRKIEKRKVRKIVKGARLQGYERKRILQLLKQEMLMAKRISRLERMQTLFKYWHVAHLPFALIMLIIALIHVGITLALGYKWIL